MKGRPAAGLPPQVPLSLSHVLGFSALNAAIHIHCMLLDVGPWVPSKNVNPAVLCEFPTGAACSRGGAARQLTHS